MRERRPQVRHARGIFGVVPPRPPIPILLEGIGSDFAFIRSAKGRSGLVKVGETFDGIKVLTIGRNRVLIEVEGKKRELTIYQGLGGDSLLPAPKKEPEKKIEKAAPSKERETASVNKESRREEK